MPITLHRCSLLWLRFNGHPCWKVQHALDEQGIAYEVVTGPLSRGKRTALEALSGQRMYPVIEFEDGTLYRDQSSAMAARIRSGVLLTGGGTAS